MLTSSASQYLHPGDYLQPLPTTLDAKKSPLALLAQTCSSIGKDSGPSKSIIPPIEKKDVGKDGGGRKSESPSGKSSASSEGRKSSDRHARGSPNNKQDNMNKSSSSSSSFRTPPPKDIPPLVPVTPKSDGHKTPSSVNGGDGRTSSKPTGSSPITSMASGTMSTAPASSSSRVSSSLSLDVQDSHAAAAALSRSSLAQSLPGGKHGDNLAHSLLSHSYAGLPFFGAGGHPGLDPAAAAAAAHYSSLAAHSALLAHHKPGGMSPFVKYATVKTATGATTLVPVCSDPYCSHCKLTMSSAQLSPVTSSASGACPAGCTQCSHDKLPHHPHTSPNPPPPSSLASLSSFPHGLSSAYSTAALSNMYLPHQPFGVMPAHHGLPYICNWVAGSDYCGKRFGTSEDLLQHLRSHTSSGDASAAAAAAASLGFPYASSLGLSASALAAAHSAAHSHYSSPGSLSPNSALRAAAAAAASSPYSRSLSPNSVLAAARYHPYGKSSPGSSSLLPPTDPRSLGAYYPYAAAAALYSQRLGSVP